MSCDRVNRIISKLWEKLQNISGFWRSLTLLIVYILIGVALEEVPDRLFSSWKVQPWNPAAGWHILLLFGFGLRYIPALFTATFIEDLQQGNNLVNSAIYSICTAIIYGAASALLFYKLDINPRLERSHDVVKFAVIFVFASLILASCKMGSLLALGEIESSKWFTKTMHQWAGEATGIAMLAPPLLILLRRFPWSGKHLTLQGSPPEINFCLPKLEDLRNWLGLLAATILFTWAANGGITSQSLDYTYFTFVPLTFICAWKGFESTTVIILLINVTAVAFVGKKIEDNDPLALQFGLMTVTYVGLLLSAFVTARSQENTKRKGLEEQLRYDATHDSLTGLYNRAGFLNRLEQTINKAMENENYLFAVLFLDLDRFKTLNDRLGHLVGDKLLVEVAKKLRQCLPESALVARFGGDEFTLVVEELTDTTQVGQIAEAICQSLGETYVVDSYEVFSSVSVGIAINSSDRTSALDLLRQADIALYEAKNRGKSQYVFFDSQMYQKAVTQAELEQDLIQAVNELSRSE